MNNDALHHPGLQTSALQHVVSPHHLINPQQLVGGLNHVTIGNLPTLQPHHTKLPTIRDPEWLKVEVCREFQRGLCKRTDDCRYAHPEKHMQVTDGKVIACYDALKGKCKRESCKYLHPTNVIKQQLEFAGRQTLINNRAMLQQLMPQTAGQPANIVQPGTAQILQPGLVGYEQVAGTSAQQIGSLHAAGLSNPLYQQLPYQPLIAAGHQLQHAGYNPTAAAGFMAQPQVIPLYHLGQQQPQLLTQLQPQMMLPAHQHSAMTQQQQQQQQQQGRNDRLEVCRDYLRGNCSRGEHECRYGHPADKTSVDPNDNSVTVCMDFIKGRCSRDSCKYFHPPPHLQQKMRASTAATQQQQPSAVATSIFTQIQPQQQQQPTLLQSPQPIMLSNGYGQPPMKRQVMDTSSMNLISPGQSQLGQASQQATSLSTLYGGNTFNALSQQPAFYQPQTSDYVEVKDDKVTVCRDALQGVCVRPQCKFYHFPSANKPQPQHTMMMDHTNSFIGNFPHQQDHHSNNNMSSMDTSNFPSNNNN